MIDVALQRHPLPNCSHCATAQLTRRRFVGGAAAMGAATILSTMPIAARELVLIDTHHHFYPQEYERLGLDWEDQRKSPHFAGQVGWSETKAIEDMDRAGIRVGVLSMASTPGVWFNLNAREASQLARDCNDFAANMMSNNPGRFGLFATV